jgi:Phage integrase, N-terminal SAM-like domain
MRYLGKSRKINAAQAESQAVPQIPHAGREAVSVLSGPLRPQVRIRPFWCLVKGVEELHRDGTYHRRVKRGVKWQWESLGNDANAACAKLDVPRLLLVMPSAESEAAAPTAKDGLRVDDEVAVYLSNVSKLSPKTYKAYTRSLELFRQSCKKIYVHQITKQDLQAFDTALIEEGNEDRTRHNRVQHTWSLSYATRKVAVPALRSRM